MEKKVIDLSKETGEIKIILPDSMVGSFNNTVEGYIDISCKASDPFDLVPKSWEELCRTSCNPNGEYYINDLSCIATYNTTDIHRDSDKDRNLFATYRDAEAFLALIQLRRLWHEWVRVLGEPKWGAEHVIRYERDTHEFVSYPSKGILTFKEESHAEKFIECFPELLEKAKILL